MKIWEKSYPFENSPIFGFANHSGIFFRNRDLIQEKIRNKPRCWLTYQSMMGSSITEIQSQTEHKRRGRERERGGKVFPSQKNRRRLFQDEDGSLDYLRPLVQRNKEKRIRKR